MNFLYPINPVKPGPRASGHLAEGTPGRRQAHNAVLRPTSTPLIPQSWGWGRRRGASPLCTPHTLSFLRTLKAPPGGRDCVAGQASPVLLSTASSSPAVAQPADGGWRPAGDRRCGVGAIWCTPSPQRRRGLTRGPSPGQGQLQRRCPLLCYGQRSLRSSALCAASADLYRMAQPTPGGWRAREARSKGHPHRWGAQAVAA